MTQTTPTEARIKRTARLFRAGDYPDRDAVFTIADLDAVVARFVAEREANAAPVPVRIEHTQTALDPLGEVTEIYRRGAELWGTLALAPHFAAHLKDTGARHVSVTLSRQNGEPDYRLVEVSVVRDPVIKDAGFVDDGESAFGQTTPAPVSAADCDALFASFRRAGKITPAMEAVLRPLLVTDTPEARFAQAHPANLFDAVNRLLTVMPQTRTMGNGDAAELVALGHGTETNGDYSPILEKTCAGFGVPTSAARKYF